MHIFSAFLFALSANIDNLTVGTAYGIKKVKISIISNLLIAAISCLGTFLSMFSGKFIYSFIPIFASNILGSLILILLGVWCILSSKLKKDNIEVEDELHNIINYDRMFVNPERVDSDNSGNIDVKESLTLAFALTINNLALGIGASITGLNIPISLVLVFIFSILFIIIGNIIGKSYFSSALGKHSSLISGIIIIVLGLYNILL